MESLNVASLEKTKQNSKDPISVFPKKLHRRTPEPSLAASLLHVLPRDVSCPLPPSSSESIDSAFYASHTAFAQNHGRQSYSRRPISSNHPVVCSRNLSS